MIMLKKIALVGVLVALVAAVSAPAFAAQAIQGSARNISPTTNSLLGGTAACRMYSVSGAELGINLNQCATAPACCNARCVRPYGTATFFGTGGYRCNQENTAGYNNDADNQTFYNLIDAEAGAGTCNHVAFFAVQGEVASSLVLINVGDDRQAGCPGTATINCFTAADISNVDSTPLTSTAGSFGPVAHQIAAADSLSPVPTVRVSAPGAAGCAPGSVRLTWDDPPDYGATMRGVPSPVQGVNLYMNNSPCGTCPNGSDGWNQIQSLPMGAGATGVCQPIAAQSWFALTVRVKGPSNGPTSIETGRSGATGFVGANSQCVGPAGTVAKIVTVAARYAGRGTVSVNWTTGSEGGVSGYYVTRATSPTGPFTRISDEVATTGDGSQYTVSDKVRTSMRMVYYQVEVVNADGTTETSGVVSATLPGPKVKKLGTN
jgi:hypothetical protein